MGHRFGWSVLAKSLSVSVVKAHCTMCQTDLKLDCMGVSAVISHLKGPKHVAKLK